MPIDPSVPLYGLDIETDTSAGGLDPSRAAVTSVAVAGPIPLATAAEIPALVVMSSGDRADRDAIAVVLDSALLGEEELLAALDALLGTLAPGVIATWNGSAFDLPFLADRYALHQLALGPSLEPDPSRAPKYGPLPGHAGSYGGHWGAHGHVDVATPYAAVADALEVPWSLKPVATALSLDPVVEDRAALHTVSAMRRVSYVASDAVVTVRLAERIRAHLDRDPHPHDATYS